MKTAYVVGFMLSQSMQDVLLIRKNKPEWQIGLLNGVGGKLEDADNGRAAVAMMREFQEESGIQTEPQDWSPYCHLEGPEFKVDVFASTGPIHTYQNKTDERLEITGTAAISGHKSVVQGLTWLVPMAVEHLKGKGSFYVTVDYWV